MKITIEQYIALCFEMRNSNKHDFFNINDIWKMEQTIRKVQAEVADRLQLDLPVRFINSYNVDSCIVELSGNKDYYHIIDLSMFCYFHGLLGTLELNFPNVAVFMYRELRRDICLSKHNEKETEYYAAKAIYVNEHERINAGLPVKFTESQMASFDCMLSFYFLHEYSHYFLKNPVRESSNEFVDSLFKSFIKDVADNDVPYLNKEIQQMAVNKLRNDWKSNYDLREEVYCDFQAILCLLELPGRYKYISADMIFDSAMSFLYIQHIIWQAKRIDEPIEFVNDFAFRQSMIAFFAYLMEEKDFSDLICQLLQRGNRFFVPTKFDVTPSLWTKQQRFYAWFTHIYAADRYKQIKDGKYVFPIFCDS